MTELKVESIDATLTGRTPDRYGQWGERSRLIGTRCSGTPSEWRGRKVEWRGRKVEVARALYEAEASRVDRADVGIRVALTVSVEFDDMDEAEEFLRLAVERQSVELPPEPEPDDGEYLVEQHRLLTRQVTVQAENAREAAIKAGNPRTLPASEFDDPGLEDDIIVSLARDPDDEQARWDSASAHLWVDEGDR